MNSQLNRIGEKKIFYELDVHHSRAQEAEMSLTSAKSSLESSNKRFWAQEAEINLTAKCSLESARKNFS